MARMIPTFPVTTGSPGEPEIFVRLRDDPGTQTWTVLHSVDIAKHRSQVSGEADFIILVPNKGVVFAEVKACKSLRREQGVWFLGGAPGDSRGPFKQAAEAMHSLREKIVKARPDFSRIPFCSCVVFTHLPFEAKSVEWHTWQVVDSKSLRAAPISRLFNHVLASAREHFAALRRPWFHEASAEPYTEQCDAIADFLRADFESLPDTAVMAKQRASEVRRCTDEQLLALDAMATNPRVIFSGPAGTGKTVLAMKAAQYAAASSSRTLLLCYNRLLGGHLAARTAEYCPQVTMRTLHAYMLEVAGTRVPDNADRDFWESVLPSSAIDALLGQGGSDYKFDQIVVDEAQDVLRHNYLDFLDLLLVGGLSAGKWKLFGDFEKQAIYGSANLTTTDFVARLAAVPAEYRLRTNCRNTPSIAAAAQHLGGLSPGYSRVLREHDGIEPIYMFYRDRQEQSKFLEEALSKLYADGFRGDDIVILSTRGHDEAAAHIVGEPWKQRLKKYSSGSAGYVRYCSIAAFKGLEAGAIVITDLDDVTAESFEALTYIGVTRAFHRLVLLIHESVKPLLLRRSGS